MKKKISHLQRWNKSKILKEIQQISDFSAKLCQKKYPSLYGAAVRHFGSWKSAVNDAGYNYAETLKRKPSGYWTERRILDEIQKLKNKKSTHARQNNPTLYSAAIRVFTSWEKAIEALSV